MHKIVILTFSIINFLSLGYSYGQADNDRGEMNLQGNVKSLSTTTYEIVNIFGKISKGEPFSESSPETIYFNKSGYETMLIKYYSNGTISSKQSFTYNNQNKIVEENYYNDNSLESKILHIFDNNGHKFETTSYYGDGSLKYKKVYTNDFKGNLIEENHYNSDGELSARTVYKYDYNGNQIERSKTVNVKSGNNVVKTQNLYKYDLNGNMIESAMYKQDGSLFIKQNMEYEDGRQTGFSTAFGDKSGYSEVNYKYDQWENIVSTIKREYDPISTSEYTAEFKYDSKNNWIWKLEYINYIPKYIVERSIEYFD